MERASRILLRVPNPPPESSESSCWDSPLRHGCHQYAFLGGIRLGTVPEAI